MKKTILAILFILGLVNSYAQDDPVYPPAPASPQNITAAEYFIDTDPGIGNASSISISAGIDLSNIAATINTTGLSNGIHRVFIRTRNAEGRWSMAFAGEFVYDANPGYPAVTVAQNITAAEYFVDTDPGFGNGTAISITPGVDVNNIAAIINTSALSNGFHLLFIRTRNAEGRWSIVAVRDFVVDSNPAYPTPPATPQNIVVAEYFINTDPGIGNGISITITPGTDLNNIAATINTSALPVSSTNNLFIRTRNAEGRWSVAHYATFVVNIANDPAYPPSPAVAQNIVAAEYFINNDPGIGNATSISVTPGVDINNIAATINTTGLPVASTNQLFIRTRNNEGRWSVTNVSTFVVDIASDPVYPPAPTASQNIVKAEYFIDTDPGPGSGTNISISPGTDISNIAFVANTNGLSTGEHNLFIRSLNNEGKWSITNARTFNVGTLTILPDSIVFINTIINTSSARSLVVKNNSSTVQSVTGLTVGAPFSSDFTGTRNINPGLTDTIRISFTPTAAILYQDNISLQTSAGNYNIAVRGTGVAVINSWTLDPATGRNYGNVQVGNSSNFSFTIRNTGNAAITLSQVSSSDPAFVPSFTSGTIIGVGGTLSLPVAFNPTAVATYNATLKIKASAGGPDSVTTSLSGTGFIPSTPPSLNFITGAPYDGIRGVNPAAGQTGNYTYKILYRSTDNRAPANGYPQIGIDLTGDQDFDDAGEGVFPMSKEGTSTDYVTGVVYTYTANFTNYNNNMGYRFFAQDALGNAANSGNIAYYSGPIVTFQVLDLKLFANDISFSKNNPLPGESFTVTAKITNNTAFSATNVPIYFYRDTILIGTSVLPAANAFSTATISRTLSFAADGFYPIKVWIDPNQTLTESNILNNYAIRPVIVGTPVLPGGINVTGNAVLQTCPAQRVVFSGRADYYGTAIPTAVAGAEVTINTGTAILKTTTDANGNYNLVMENPACGGSLTYTVSVTDFTFTSNTFTGAVNVPCPLPGACAPPPITGGISVVVTGSPQPCDLVVGNNASTSVTIRYRGRNIANFWSGFDLIWKDTVKIFNNGVLIQTYYTDDIPDFGSAATFPGDEKTYPVTVPLNTSGPNVITAVATYQYNEFFQIPSSLYKGVFTNMTATAGTTIIAQENQPDLTIDNFVQTSFRSFSFNDRNLKCNIAGSHVVRVVDITNPGAPVLLYETTAGPIGSQSAQTISVSLPTLSIGTHVLRIVTDTTGLVTEIDENNNAFVTTIVVPAPDLTVEKTKPSTSNLSIGSSVTFSATIKNSGVATGAFVVRFLANGTPIGSDIAVSGVGEKSQVTVSSNSFNVTTNDADCPVDITVFADATGTISEGNELNNAEIIKLGSDTRPLQLPGEFGSASNPVRVRVNTAKTFNAYIRNMGTRDIRNVTVKFMYNSNKIGEALVPLIKAGEQFPAVASFNYTFNTPGPATVSIETDTANTICEINEGNNTGNYHIVVTDSREDLEVLSQYISPSSLNPNAGQNITLVGTVKNVGNRVSPASSMRFYVDNIQLGAPVPFNALQIGQDTTIAATTTYSSIIGGLKVVKIVVDQEGLVAEENENNNEATRIIIVGDAPDMAKAQANAISFNPTGFRTGDSVTVSYRIKNNGPTLGTAWVIFKILDETDAVIAKDSVQFTLAANGNTIVSKKMLFDVIRGTVVTEIVNCSPLEFDLLNNNDSLAFSTVQMLTASLTVNGDVDMKAGLPQQFPGWIGGKLVLGNYDLVVNGRITNFDTAHFVITNGTGKLRMVNNNASNTFPVGVSLFKPNFAKVNNTGTSDNFSVSVVPYVLRSGTSGDTIRTANVNRTWFIDEDVPGGSNVTLEMFWAASDELPAFDRTISRMAHYKGAWLLGDIGAAVIDTNGMYSKTQSGYTSFSPFTVTSGTSLIPLRFINFTATPAGKDVLLNWITEAEINTSHFEAEYSKDGIVFEAIGRVKSMNTAGQHQYEFKHVSPVGNILYYRIKQVDLDGRFQYSKIVSVRMAIQSNIVLSPNPASNYIRLSNIRPADIRELQMVSTDGKLIMAVLPNNNLQIDISGLKNGYYLLRIIRKDNSVETKQFVKQ